MARFPSIDTNGNFESPQVLDRIKDHVGITVDNSVGTRVFVGDTMIYGNTGVRNVLDRTRTPEGFTWDSDHPPTLQRVNNIVTLEMTFSVVEGIASRDYILGLSAGFAADRNLTLGVDIDGRSAFIFTSDGYDLRMNTAQLRGTNLSVTYSWATSQAWPTSLPGIPA